MLRSSMIPRPARLAVTALFLALAACAGVRGLDEDPLPLSTDERARVGRQVDKALEERRWTTAWNQAVDAGADRARLEGVALAALKDDDGAAEDMFEALLAKWGGLTPDARGRVTELVQQALRDRHWERAVEMELLTAEDAPAYAAAWALYDDAPPNKAEDVLQAITEARAEREKAD